MTVGGTPRTSVKEYWDGDVPWMASGDVHLKRITDVPTRITKLGLRFSNATLVEPPAVAISLAGQGKTRGTAALVLCRLCTNQSVALIKGSPTRVVTDYLFYNLEFRYEELRSRSAGEGRAGLSKRILEQVPVPLPPLSDQTRIAEILSTVDRAIEQTEALIAKQQRIKTGLMQDLLTRGIDKHGNLRSEQTHQFKDSPLGRIPVEWEVKRLEELTEQIVDGIHHTPTYVQTGVPFIVVSDLTAGPGICFTNSRLVSPEDHLQFVKRANPKSGDVLVTKDGTLGVARIVDKDAPEFSIFVSVAMLRPRTEICFPELIWSFFDCGQFLRQIGALSAGTGLAHIHLEHFRKFLIRRPPIREQCMIFKVVAEHDLLLRQELVSFKKLKRQKAALMQDLFTRKRGMTNSNTA